MIPGFYLRRCQRCEIGYDIGTNHELCKKCRDEIVINSKITSPKKGKTYEQILSLKIKEVKNGGQKGF